MPVFAGARHRDADPVSSSDKLLPGENFLQICAVWRPRKQALDAEPRVDNRLALGWVACGLSIAGRAIWCWATGIYRYQSQLAGRMRAHQE